MSINNVDEFSKLPTTAVSDGLKGYNTMDFAIKPLSNHTIAGRAYTVKMPKGQNKEVLKAIKEASVGDVLVIDTEDDTSKAIAGDFILGMAQTLGINGIVTNGVIRDIEGIKKLDFPVFCKGTTTNAGSKSDEGISNVPVTCGGVVVQQGDIIIGDTDGVVVVPREIEAETLEKAKKKVQKDDERDAKVSDNVQAIHEYIDNLLK
ncbi:RraA family protein [Virgibacillus sp. NKC19-16]|uniref:RraA family protein n=1 Tax=Virgibacillus salidurans TaxID=2831673 RepID=UPI001F1975FB|nr:RraA family protein [Virgibacillus sp. NKC19-16]UJL46272.1 RraA family protein [Virgibacillus sp. NKC19-16]